MAKCSNCGSRRLKLSECGDWLKCQDCSCSNIPDKPEYRAAAAKFKTLLDRGHFAKQDKS